MSWRIKLIVSALLGATLAACSDPAPRPPEQPPAVDRPVLLLAGAQPIRVPRAAIVERAGVTGVYVLDSGRARFRMVKTGTERDPSQVEILSGLTGNETLVLGDFAGLYDGHPVRIH